MAVKEIELSVPTEWSDIKLKKWLELQKELDNYKDDEEAISALMLYHLCGLPPEYVAGLSIDDYVMIKTELANFINNVEDIPLQKFIYIDGVEYGFEPNLSNMTYGAFADITKYNTIQIDDNWASIMSILYRPVDKRQGDMYTIKPYTGEINPKLFLEVGMHVHFGSLFFFVNLLKDLQIFTLKSMKEMELPPNIKSILGRNGERIQQLLNLQEETSLKLTK
jgi:hypothetical protein